MTYTSIQTSGRRATALRTADVAGIEWPVYKLEALALGFIAFAATLVLAGSLQAAVLLGAAVTVVTWWALRLTELQVGLFGQANPPSAGQATRSE